MQFDNFELVHCYESKVNELLVSLYFASLAVSIAEICSLQNYTSTKLCSVHIRIVCVFSPVVTLST